MGSILFKCIILNPTHYLYFQAPTPPHFPPGKGGAPEPELDLSTLPGEPVPLLTPDLALKVNPVVVLPSKVWRHGEVILGHDQSERLDCSACCHETVVGHHVR